MNINFTGHGLEVTQALRDFTAQKLEKLEKHFDNISRIHVTFGVQHLTQVAEARLVIPGTEVHAKASSNDMYTSIDELYTKLNRQLDKHKGKTRSKPESLRDDREN